VALTDVIRRYDHSQRVLTSQSLQLPCARRRVLVAPKSAVMSTRALSTSRFNVRASGRRLSGAHSSVSDKALPRLARARGDFVGSRGDRSASGRVYRMLDGSRASHATVGQHGARSSREYQPRAPGARACIDISTGYRELMRSRDAFQETIPKAMPRNTATQSC